MEKARKPHGRLIDADALKEQLDIRGTTEPETDKGKAYKALAIRIMDIIAKEIDKAPTVIPAEEVGDVDL